MPTHLNDSDELPFDVPPWKAYELPPGRRVTERQRAHARLRSLEARCSSGGSIYLMQLANDVLKVGAAVDPDVRKKDHRRSTGQAIVRKWASPTHVFHGLNEQAMITALHGLGRIHRGREWFVGVDFDAAVQLAESLLFLPPIVLEEQPPARRAWPVGNPPLYSCGLRIRAFQVPRGDSDLDWADLTVFERVGIMARRGLSAESIAVREDLPVEVVPGLAWYFENQPDIRHDHRRDSLVASHWAAQVNDYCARWEPIVEARLDGIRQQVADHAASFLADLNAELSVATAQEGAARVS